MRREERNKVEGGGGGGTGKEWGEEKRREGVGEGKEGR